MADLYITTKSGSGWATEQRWSGESLPDGCNHGCRIVARVEATDHFLDRHALRNVLNNTLCASLSRLYDACNLIHRKVEAALAQLPCDDYEDVLAHAKHAFRARLELRIEFVYMVSCGLAQKYHGRLLRSLGA